MTSFFFLVLPALSQEADTAWVRTYNGPGNISDNASAIAVDDSGNVYVAGSCDVRPTMEGAKYVTIKYYPNGDAAWVRRYSGPAKHSDRAYAVAVDACGNVYVTGSSSQDSSYPSDDTDYATIKYDIDGRRLWVRTYDGLDEDWNMDGACDIAVDSSGNVCVTGTSTDSETGTDYTTIKYDRDGNLLWLKRYDGIGYESEDHANAMVLDAHGNVYITGESHGPRSDPAGIDWESVRGEVWLSTPDYVTIKYDPLGNELWVRRYDGPGNAWDWAYDIAVDASGNVYVTGSSYGAEANSRPDYATIKYDSSGNQLWVRRYNGPENRDDVAEAVAVDTFGNVYVTGRSIGVRGMVRVDYDYVTIKYDANGDQLWLRRYDGPKKYSSDQAEAIALDGLGHVYVTGSSGTIIYDTDGNQLQLWTGYNGNAMTADRSGNIYVVGYITQKGTRYPYEHGDFLTVKYVQKSNSSHNEDTKQR